MNQIYNIFQEIIPLLLVGFLIGKREINLSKYMINPLISTGIPISVMGLILKSGININLIKSTIFSLFIIVFTLILINYIPILKSKFKSKTLQLGSLIGNTSFLGIPLSIALLPEESLNSTIGYDLGATFFAWTFGPYLLNLDNQNKSRIKSEFILKQVIRSPAVKGLIGAFIINFLPWSNTIATYLWIPSKIVIYLAIVIVGIRMGKIYKEKSFHEYNLIKIKDGIILKLLVLPLFSIITLKLFNVETNTLSAIVIQSSTPTSVSTLLIAELYNKEQNLAASMLLWSTLLGIIIIPIWRIILLIVN
tara:strand:- start:862 stop:1782 length:921 start_codon:yes stop_codon:yes gene_type:complete